LAESNHTIQGHPCIMHVCMQTHLVSLINLVRDSRSKIHRSHCWFSLEKIFCKKKDTCHVHVYVHEFACARARDAIVAGGPMIHMPLLCFSSPDFVVGIRFWDRMGDWLGWGYWQTKSGQKVERRTNFHYSPEKGSLYKGLGSPFILLLGGHFYVPKLLSDTWNIITILCTEMSKMVTP
jgi:hypothetical protein